MIFFLSSLDYCANCQADSYPCSPKWLLSSVKLSTSSTEVQLSSPPSSYFQFSPKKPDSVICISWTCCRLALFASLPWTSWPCIERGRESGTLYWKHWEELKITRCLFSIQHSDKLMTFNRLFFLVWGNFLFCCGWGSVSPSLMQWLFLKPWRLETLAHSTWQGPQVSEVLPNLGVRTLLPPVRPRQGPQRTYRLHLFCQLQDNLGVLSWPRLSLTLLSYPVINLLTWPGRLQDAL